jgi:arabinan endo-1,5-alpha-L-arabinosidase
MDRRLRGCVVVGALALLVAPLACGSEELPSSSEPAGGAAGRPNWAAGTAGIAHGGSSSSSSGAAAQPEGGLQGEAGHAGEVAHGGAAGGAGAPTLPPLEPAVLATTGATQQVHDPFIAKDGGTYYLFSTGIGIGVRTSTDLLAWKGAGSVFASKPSWITTTDPGNPNHLWAPEVRYFGGKFHLYYSASRFGSKQSCIGHATRASLGSGPDWVDDGEALLCSNLGGNQHDYNAIDPSPFEGEDGQIWLAFGSFWGGLKLVRLDEDGRRDGPDFFSLATRANTAVEAPQLHYRAPYYYLFESVDSCCQGVNSTYKIMVGRASDVEGPYVDVAGGSLAEGAGSLVLSGGARWRGPGHNAILVDGARTYNVYHSYDADSNGVPTLRIADLTWTDDGWPISAGP